MGTVAGFENVSVEFTGSITASGGLEGTLRLGVNGELPQGEPISYKLSGVRG